MLAVVAVNIEPVRNSLVVKDRGHLDVRVETHIPVRRSEHNLHLPVPAEKPFIAGAGQVIGGIIEITIVVVVAIEKAFDDAVKEANLKLFDDEGTPISKLQFRDLRPTAASNMLDFGLNETQISKILGHVDTRMVGQVYLRKIQDDTMLKAADKIEQGMKERLAV